MRKNAFAIFVLVGIVLLGCILFTHWWKEHTLAPSSSLQAATPTPVATFSPVVTSMLGRLQPLKGDVQTQSLLPQNGNTLSGAVRYSLVGDVVSFTILVDPTDEPLNAWLVSSEGQVNLGTLLQSKGGLLINGQAKQSVFPIQLYVTKQGKKIDETGGAVLQGSISL
ncbi:hypothetical protein C5B42_02950 [Candidatus Cerribacteria bacterium 'Amazon FNV 2010 28 9']|uniref:Uncharacterized protein n=1 Tax=Candidatus Cerribacteria bacterium 'Amazon FNV 2010 28 9' TaxID=2081795 RepID=A0A317JU06_9BACT|nr:MAG: hypothetical protein C5B42_02950 [Candidatus Cerribacteria bacterium 'Amazon FNV 2010 28 9']